MISHQSKQIIFKLTGFGTSLISKRRFFIQGEEPNEVQQHKRTTISQPSVPSPPQLTHLKKREIALDKEILVFVAPEVILDSESTGEKSDVYAFGMLIFQLLTNQPPHLHPPLKNLEKWGKKKNQITTFKLFSN